MSDTEPRPVWPRTPSRLLMLVGLLAVACVNLVPRQGWDPAAGPVVPHDSFPADCSLCHEAGDWHTIREDFTFDHEARTGVALDGAHAKASCLLCHNDRGPVQAFAVRGCGGCHADPHLMRLGDRCQDCHDERTWVPHAAVRDHASTRFPLVGAHAATACFRCHAGAQVGNFAGASVECVDCHRADLARATDPDHAQVGFSQQCDMCHLPVGWRPARFDHPDSFPLTRGHAGRSCAECHPTPNTFTGLSTDCESCHDDDFAATVEPNHSAAGFGRDCEQCHSTTAFRFTTWSHPGSFELSFGHAGRNCSECHVGQVYSGTSDDCSSCHLDDHQATTNPNHTTAGFGLDCEQCHITARWNGAMVDHPATFPLEHSHQQACSACHQSGVYAGLDPTCSACHLPAYQATRSPNHGTAGFGTDCELCHGIVTWAGAQFEHPVTFPLENSHQQACTACHQTGVYAGLDPTCAACHLTEFQKTTEPPHAAAGFGTDCETCHGSVTWSGAQFQHTATFPLENSHQQACTACHQSGVYVGLDPNCVSCHLAEYQKAVNPPHASFGMSQQCQECHTTVSWGAGTWQHAFPIQGGRHGGLNCFDCHNNPANRLQFSCIDCHEHNQAEMADEHDDVPGYVWATAQCIACHPTGEK